MTTQSGPDAFLQQTDLPAPRSDPAARPPIAYLTDREQAVIVGSDLIVFVKGIAADQREDIVNAAALAQLAASKQVPQPKTLEDVVTWQSAYNTTLSKLGFVLQDPTFGEYYPTATIKPHEVVLALASAVLGNAPSSLRVVTQHLNTLSTLPAESTAIAILNDHFRSAQTGRFQVMLAEPTPSGELQLSMVGVGMEVRSKATPALFSVYQRSEIGLRYTTESARPTPRS